MYSYFLPGIKKSTGRYLSLLLLIFISQFAKSQDSSAVIKNRATFSRVQVADTSFFIPGLNYTTAIRIYLPEGYRSNNKRYPVIYMYGGQNIFDENRGDTTKWNVDGCLDSLSRKGKPGCIVIAFDDMWNEKQDSTNVAFPNDTILESYANFLIKTLKPFIDKHYRTLSTKENTIIAGADAGALIAYHAMRIYPNVFGKAGIFSPPFLLTMSGANNQTEPFAEGASGKFFFYLTGQDVPDEMSTLNFVDEKLGNASNTMLYVVEDADGANDVSAWRKWFAEFYNWIMADGFNYVIRVEK